MFRTGSDPFHDGNDISMNDRENGVFSTISCHKLARMGVVLPVGDEPKALAALQRMSLA